MHTHISAVHIGAGVLAVGAVYGTLHLLALTAPDSRPARALLALGF